jgi:hypothetical protein
LAQKPLLRSRPGRLQFDQTERQQHDRRTIRSRALRRNMFEFAEVLARAVQIQRSNANLYVADSSHTYLIRSLPVLGAVSLFLLFSRAAPAGPPARLPRGLACSIMERFCFWFWFFSATGTLWETCFPPSPCPRCGLARDNCAGMTTTIPIVFIYHLQQQQQTHLYDERENTPPLYLLFYIFVGHFSTGYRTFFNGLPDIFQRGACIGKRGAGPMG